MCDTSCMTRMSDIPLELLNGMTPAGRALVEMLCARIQEQDQIIASQQKRIEELERRVGMNSGNSSLPTTNLHPNCSRKTDSSVHGDNSRESHRHWTEKLPSSVKSVVQIGIPCFNHSSRRLHRYATEPVIWNLFQNGLIHD